MNRLRAARQPMTFCTPFRSRIGSIRVMAETFSGLASMARWEMMKAQEHPSRDSEHALLGVELYPFDLKAIERDPEIGYQAVCLPGLHDNVVDICLYVPPDMVSEHVEHTSLVCSSGISEAKGHRDIAVHAKRCDKRGRELVGLFHFDLMVTGIHIKKG